MLKSKDYNAEIPSRETCLELLISYGTPTHVIHHCKAVSKTALRMARALIEKGLPIDLSLLEAASLLHDIARVEENHGPKGAAFLEEQGYLPVAELVESHMIYAVNPYKDNITEQDLLCLADRMVQEDKYVGLDVRMNTVFKKLEASGIDTKRIRVRLEENKIIQNRIEKIIGKSIDTLMR